MSTVLEKVRRLEQYVAADEKAIDPVVEQAIDKLLERELLRLTDLRMRLEAQLVEFEQQYKMPTLEFYSRFENGELGDETDYLEWSATFEMLQNLDRRVQLLQTYADL